MRAAPPPVLAPRIMACLAVLALGAAACSDDVAEARDESPVAEGDAYRSETYASGDAWLCRPDLEDVCDGSLDATVVPAGDTLTPEPFEPAEDPRVDCFYVYPTISRDPGLNSDLDASDEEEGYAARNQVARLAETCRIFAPVYRQVTLGGLALALSGALEDDGSDPASGFGLAGADVLDAWRHYLANDNDGRGVVLVGHSQGASLLRELLATEIEPDPDVRSRLVAAYLAGTAVAVPEGADVGGDFTSVPLCRDREQTGCVVTWSSYRATAPPPPAALFGRPRDGEGVAGCNSPAALDGGRRELQAYFPSSPAASILADLGVVESRAGWTTAGTVETPFVSLPGLVSGECVERGGVSYLEVEVLADPTDARVDDIAGDLTPEWGLHLVDYNLVMGDVVDLVALQADAYLGD